MSRLFSVTEYAKLAGITRQGVGKAIREKRLKAFKVGHQWAIKTPPPAVELEKAETLLAGPFTLTAPEATQNS